MAAMGSEGGAFAPGRGLYPVTKKPVTKKPEDPAKSEFVRLVWRQLTLVPPADGTPVFTTIKSFEEWFNKTLVPRTIESLGGKQVGGMLLHDTFNGGVAHFMRWVMMKFTTTTSPGEVAAEDKRTRELRKMKTKSAYFRI